MLDEYGVRLNVLGRVEMLPEKVQESVRIAQAMTKNNDRCTTPGPSSFSRSDDVFFLKVYPEPLYALHIKGRDSYGGTVCCAGKGCERPGRYTTSVRALPACHYPLIFTAVRTRITEEDIERYMMTNLAGSPPLDILVRSSGVKRLSDFLMWQVRFPTTRAYCLVSLMGVLLQASENVQLHFTPTYWPDIGFWDLFPVILDYQAKVWSRQPQLGV